MIPPTLTQYNHWGQRVDNLSTSEGWRVLKGIAQSEGLVGIYYDRDYAEFSRVYGFAKTLMMVGDAQVVSCCRRVVTDDVMTYHHFVGILPIEYDRWLRERYILT